MISVAHPQQVYVQALINNGFEQKQANEMASSTSALIDSMISEHYSTKSDIKQAVMSMETALKDLELRLTLRLGAIMIGSVALISFLKTI